MKSIFCRCILFPIAFPFLVLIGCANVWFTILAGVILLVSYLIYGLLWLLSCCCFRREKQDPDEAKKANEKKANEKKAREKMIEKGMSEEEVNKRLLSDV